MKQGKWIESDRVVQKGFSEEVAFQQNPKMREWAMCISEGECSRQRGK